MSPSLCHAVRGSAPAKSIPRRTNTMRRISTRLLRADFRGLLSIARRSCLAQLPTTIAISSHTQEVDDLLSRGQQLELERRWGNALTHYEEALRQFPAENSLAAPFRYGTPALRYPTPLDRSQFRRYAHPAAPGPHTGPLRPGIAEDRFALCRHARLERTGRAGHQ